jgi:excinuclease ABC subunit A
VIPETPARIWNLLQKRRTESAVVITFPYLINGASIDQVRRSLRPMGFDRLFLKNQIIPLEDWQPKGRQKEIPVLADRLILRPADKERVLDSLELAFRFGGGRLDVWLGPDEHYAFNNRLACADCNIAYSAPLPNLFSFNSPVGACDTCRGFGRTIGIDMDLVIPDHSLSLAEGAVKAFGKRPHGIHRPDGFLPASKNSDEYPI